MTVCLARKRHMRRKPLLTAAGLLTLGTPLLFGSLHSTRTPAQSQGQNGSATQSVFEVASIKLNKHEGGMMRLGLWGERFLATGMTTQGLIREAFGIQDDQILGRPRWLNSETYDIEAKVEPAVADRLHRLSFDQRLIEYRRMLQSVLADRFKFVFHRESKELPMFALVVAKKGTKIEEAKPGDTYPNGMKDLEGNGHGDIMHFGRGQLIGQGIAISNFVEMLSQLGLGLVIVDKTGLTAKYDFTLQWTPDQGTPMSKRMEGELQPAGRSPLADSFGPSLFTAMEEQLGLKLERQEGPVDVLVIDHLERPSEN
jgi:bla regulator protein blaR1